MQMLIQFGQWHHIDTDDVDFFSGHFCPTVNSFCRGKTAFFSHNKLLECPLLHPFCPFTWEFKMTFFFLAKVTLGVPAIHDCMVRKWHGPKSGIFLGIFCLKLMSHLDPTGNSSRCVYFHYSLSLLIQQLAKTPWEYLAIGENCCCSL